jgi:hypothetical protein
MRCTLATAAVVCLLASEATAQDRPPKSRSGIESDELKRLEHPLLRPEVGQPDTTLLDDTRASGLRPRLVHGEPPKPEGLPIGRRCIVYTADGREFSGLLMIQGKWIFLHPLGDGRKTWIAMDHVVAIEEIDPARKLPSLNGRGSP